MQKKDGMQKALAFLNEVRDFMKGTKKFAKVTTADGKMLIYEGDTPVVGAAVMMPGDKGDMPAPDGEYTLEDGSVLVVAGGVITDIKAPQGAAATPQGESEFMKYLSSDAYKGEKYNFADYPWEQCISEQQAQGVDCPECVCSAIKNRTVKHLVEKKMAKDTKEAVSIIQKSFKDPVIAYLMNTLMSQPQDMKAQIETLLKKVEAFAKIEERLKNSEAANEKLMQAIEMVATSASTESGIDDPATPAAPHEFSMDEALKAYREDLKKLNSKSN